MLSRPASQRPWKTYIANLFDKHLADSVTSQISNGLTTINQNSLPGKFKVWYSQLTLYNSSLFGRNTLILTTSLGYKKVRLVFQLKVSSDLSVQNTNAQVCT